MIKNLIFKGGGVAGIAYSGAILELEKAGLTKNLERTAGTSAGALPACMLAMKMTAKEIFDIVSSCDFSKFQDHGNPLNVIESSGYYRGEALLQWIESIIAKKAKAMTTFADFHKAGFLDLHVFATNLNTRNIAHFCNELTPNVIVAEAIRASMGIPLFFESFTLTGDNNVYVDGGCIDNFPLKTFDKYGINNESLGLYLGNLGVSQPNNLKKNEFLKVVEAVANSIMNAQNIDLQMSSDDLKRIVQIDSCNVSATNFNLTFEDKKNLFESGRNSIINYLTKINKWKQ